MSVRLSINPKLTATAQQLCRDYWSFENEGGYVNYVKALCKEYAVTPPELFRIIEKCSVCLDDVCCESCSCFCPVDVPADIPYRRSKDFWFCEACVNFSCGQVLIGR